MYHPSPACTPTASATISVRNDAPSPMNSPTKMLGIAAGIATRSTRYDGPAPSVRATSRYDACVFDTPDSVSIVTGNHTAIAISEIADHVALGNNISAIGISAVAGIGPITFMTGIPQYRTGAYHPISTPHTIPSADPR